VPSRFGVDLLLPRDANLEDEAMKQSQTYPLRLPRPLKEAVEDRTSINQFVATAVAEKVLASQTARYFADRKARRISTHSIRSCGGGAGARRPKGMAFRGGRNRFRNIQLSMNALDAETLLLDQRIARPE
jgi:hypothetical protein